MSLSRRGFLAVLTGAPLAFAPEAAFSRTSAGLQGQYTPPPTGHPFVFATGQQLIDLASSSGVSALSARLNLKQRSTRALANSAAHIQAFSGCSLDRYLADFGHERRGASQAASTLGLYAHLASHDTVHGDQELADRARQACKDIVLNWAVHGLRDNGVIRKRVDQFCDERGQVTRGVEFAVALQIGRGVPYLVHAVDLLLAQDALSGQEARVVEAFLDDLHDLLLTASNFRAVGSNLDCNRFSNHVSIHLAAIAALARFRGDRAKLEDVAFGKHGKISIPWTRQVGMAIYGAGSAPLNCFPNGKHAEFSQTPNPVAGEIVDRYRAGEAQTLGYPMFSLTHLLLAASIIQSAGYDAYGFPPNGERPLLSALRYYAGYFSRLLAPTKTLVPAGFPYPGSDQYVGRLVSSADGATIDGRDGLLLPYLLALPAYRDDDGVQSVLRRARQFTLKVPAFGAIDSLYMPWLVHL